MLGLKLNHVSKMGYCTAYVQPINRRTCESQDSMGCLIFILNGVSMIHAVVENAMITSWQGNTSHIIDPLWGESTSDFPHNWSTMRSIGVFFAVSLNKNRRVVGDLRRRCAHVTSLWCFMKFVVGRQEAYTASKLWTQKQHWSKFL